MTLAIMAGISALALNAQETKKLSDYDAVRFYGIDFAPVKVVGAEETAGEFVDAFSGINQLFISEPDKYITPLAARISKKIDYVNVDYANKVIGSIDTDELKINHTAEALTRQDMEYELQDLEIKPADGLGLVVVAGELNKGTDYGTFYYVFFDNSTMNIIDVLPFKGKSGGIGLRHYWARSFYRTIAEINPSKFYSSKKKIKEGVTEGFQAVKEKVTGKESK